MTEYDVCPELYEEYFERHDMGKIPQPLREIIGRNIRDCRKKKFPGRGGAKQCALAFGVSPQQWSPWERGGRTPDESRLEQIAGFFGVTVEFLRRDNRTAPGAPSTPPPPANNTPTHSMQEIIPSSLSVPEAIMTLHSKRLKAVYEVEVSIKSVKYVPMDSD